MTASVENEVNYAAIAFEVPDLEKAPNSDRLYLLRHAGLTVIVDSSWLDRKGDLAFLFPTESQIGEGLAWFANLHASQDKNMDQGQKGYLGKNRRVKALKLRGNVSSGLALPAEVVFGYTGPADIVEGDIVDTINGLEISRKFVVPVKEANLGKTQASLAKALKRVDEARFPQHIDTSHYLRNESSIHDEAQVIVTQKLHGTSVRLGHVPVRRTLSWLERLAKRLGVNVTETEYAYIAGSRKVVKDPDNPNQNHFYSRDVWTEALDAWGRDIPKGFIVYGELVGYTSSGEVIQRGYTYEASPGSMDLYIYRVALTMEGGELVDLSHDQVREFGMRYGMQVVPELWRGRKVDLNTHLDSFTEKNFYKEWGDKFGLGYNERPVKLSPGGAGVDEGVVIRVDGRYDVADFYKHKNDSFLVFESKDLDQDEAAAEAEEEVE
ncbi:RNA ligase [Microbacterium phage Welcome]|nr:RNA ligase [Microbacterium phage Welcome]